MSDGRTFLFAPESAYGPTGFASPTRAAEEVEASRVEAQLRRGWNLRR